MTVKSKGRFGTPAPGKHDLRHSVNFNIVAEAVTASVTDGTDTEDYIRDCTDINKFAITQAVTGKWRTEWMGQELGKLVRFYKSTSPQADAIIRIPPPGAKGNQGNVSNSENCIPIQDLPTTFPQDIDYQWYIDKAEEWLTSILQAKIPGGNKKAETLTKLGLTPALIPSDPSTRASRAFIEPGGMDWNSIPPGMEMGLSTGKKAGIIGIIEGTTGGVNHLYRFKGNLPSKTREKVSKDNSFTIVYGANIRFGGLWNPSIPIGMMNDQILKIWKDRFYTPAELKKADASIENPIKESEIPF